MLDDCPPPVHYGSGAQGSGGFTPRIESIGGPARLESDLFVLEVNEMLGGAFGALFVGVSPLNVPGNGWTLLVNPALILAVSYSGPAGVPGVGKLTLPATLPDDPFLDGLSIYFQAVAGDPGASGGIAATDGLEIVLCR